MSAPSALYDTEAEIAVLGSMILDRDAYRAIAEIVQPSHFYHGPHADVFRAIDRLAQDDEAIDATLLAAAMRKAGTLDRVGGTAFIVRIMQSVPTVANATHYATLVRDLAKKRDLIAAADRYAAAARNGTEAAEWKTLAEVREKLTKDDGEPEKPDYPRFDLATQLLLPPPPPPVQLVERVFTRPSVNVVFGPAGSGKSFMLLQTMLDLVMGGGAFCGFEEYQILAPATPTGSFEPAKTDKCLWIYGSEDSSQRMDIRSRKTFGSGPHYDKPAPADRFVYVTPPPGIFLGDDPGWKWLDAVIALEAPTVMVLDTVGSLVSDSVDGSRNDHVTTFLRHFHRYRDNLGISTFCVNHSRKGGNDPKKFKESAADSMLGAQAWRAQSDGLLLVHALDGDTEHALIRCLKSKDIERPIPHLAVCLNKDIGRFEPRDPDEESVPDRPAGRPPKCSTNAVLALRALHPAGVSWDSLWTLLGCAERTWNNNRKTIQSELLTRGHTVVGGILKW